MAKAIVSLTDTVRFREVAARLPEAVGQSVSDLDQQIRDWQEKISVEMQKNTALRNEVRAKCSEIEQQVSLLSASIDACRARLAVTPMFISSSDDSEETVVNPEYQALQARLSMLETEKDAAMQRMAVLHGIQSDAESEYCQLASAQDLCQISDLARQMSDRVRESAERACMLLGNISESLSQYLSVSVAGGDTSGSSGASGQGASGGASSGPRNLDKTQQGWTSTPDGQMYNSPFKTGGQLISAQGAVPGYRNTCGVVSCANIARLAGVNMSEQQALSSALSNGWCQQQKHTLFTHRVIDGGGTSPAGRQALLAHMGIDSHLEAANVNSISQRVGEGRGVIISVRAGMLWGTGENGLHAITVTSVVRNPDGSPYGFYVCDSGTNGRDASKFYTAGEIASALTPGRPMNVTTNIIR